MIDDSSQLIPKSYDLYVQSQNIFKEIDTGKHIRNVSFFVREHGIVHRLLTVYTEIFTSHNKALQSEFFCDAEKDDSAGYKNIVGEN